MATTYGTTSASTSAGYDMSLWYDSKYYKLGMGTMLLVAIFMDLVSKDICVFARDGLDGTGI